MRHLQSSPAGSTPGRWRRLGAVRDEARLALEQLEDPLVLERLQTLVDEGLLA